MIKFRISITKIFVSLVLALWATALSAQAHWTMDYRQYQQSMTVYYELKDGGKAVADATNYEIAAFVGDECRGVGILETYTGTNDVTLTYGYLRIYSNVSEGETVTFKVYDKTAEEETECNNTIDFEADAAIGLPSSPFAIKFGPEYILGDVDGDGEVKAIDASLVLQIVARMITADTPGIVPEAADVDGDGEIKAIDASLILQYIAKMITW